MQSNIFRIMGKITMPYNGLRHERACSAEGSVIGIPKNNTTGIEIRGLFLARSARSSSSKTSLHSSTIPDCETVKVP